MKRKTKIGTLVAGLLIVGFTFAFFISREAVAKYRFVQVRNGMTEGEVREILGVPNHVRHDASGMTALFYGGFRSLKWCSMEVFFGADERVTGKFHDH